MSNEINIKSLDNKEMTSWSDFKLAVPIALVIIVLFIYLQKLGIVNLIASSSKVGYGTAFIIGLVASLSSCLAVVGGLVLSMSATYAKSGESVRPQLLFHLGRLVSFFFLGGVIGFLGSSFQFNSTGTFVMGVIVAVILFILGLKLLGIFSWIRRIQPTIPSVIGKQVHSLKNLNHTLTPLLVGLATFFLPCGFTQSMQIYALSTGSFWVGSFIMLFFALGTLPVLAFLSFGSLGIHKKASMGIFFKSAGLVVIFFALFNLTNSLVAVNILPRTIFNIENTNIISTNNNVSMVDGIQIITLQAKGGYSPNKSVAKVGVPTIIRFKTMGTFDCSSSVQLPSLKVSKFLPQTGSTDINIGTSTPGIFRGSCGMGMYPFEVDFK